MTCRNIRERLELYAGDDLAGRDAAEVEAHLRTCLACYREYVDLRDLLIRVRASSRDGASGRSEQAVDALVTGIMSRIAGPPPMAPRFVARLTLVSGWAAALLLGLSLGWKSLHPAGAPTREGLHPVVHETEPTDPQIKMLDGNLESNLDAQFISDLQRLEGGGPSSAPRLRSPKPIPVRPSGRKDF